ncbi:MAG: EAL domain-containing protein [Burkholderiales bacterium]|nr:EAL domain-containing protein [Burkholderiales bacterium]
MIDSNPDAIVVLDSQNHVLICNQNYRNLWETPGTPIESLTNEARWALQLSQLSESDKDKFPVVFGQERAQRHHIFRLKTGSWYERHIYDHVINGKHVGLVIHWRDITEVQEANRAATYERELMHALMDSIPDQIFFKDSESRFLRINQSLAKRYGIDDPSLAVGKTDADFYTPEHGAKTAADERQIMETGEPLVGVLDREVWPDGSMTWNVSTKMPLYNSEGKLIGTYGIAHDITEHKKTEQLIWHQANFDALTGLPNRRLLRDRWDQALRARHRSGLDLGLLLLDLDHFKEINDSLGHAMGDNLLVQASQRIRNCLRATDSVARLGGDEFAIILTDLHSAEVASDIARKIVAALNQSFHLGSEVAYVSGSIGITLSPQDGEDIDVLLKHADQAMYQTKSRGRNGYSFFTLELQTRSQTRQRLISDLRRALPEGQLHLVYQPIVELATGRVDKAEALLRWTHPQLGPVSPSVFIPLAESNGFIVEIGEWVFRQAAAQLQAWRRTLSPQMQVSINKSPLQFQNLHASPRKWLQHLESMGLPGSAMVVEITESLLLDHSDQVQQQLAQMRETGIQVSLDDFGTGYSALSYLQRYDIDFLKIDQSFVRGLHAGSRNLALCKAIIQLSREMGMQVVAEGIETQAQCDLLTAGGCDFGQGYLFAKPLLPADFEAFARARSRA